MSLTPQASRSGVTLVMRFILLPPVLPYGVKYGIVLVLCPQMASKQVTLKKDKQTSRLYPVSDELAESIRLANALPAPDKLPGWESKGNLPVREHWDANEADVEDLISRFPLLRSFMAGVNVKDEFPLEMVQRCLQLKTIRSILYTIARLNSNNQLTGASMPVGADLENLVSVKMDAGGILRIELDPLLQTLEGAEVRRIRECPICGILYWAGRMDKPACNAECAHVLRERRYREKYREKYKENYGEYKLQRYYKAERKNPDTAATAARVERERKELESLPEHSSARRSPRLPGSHK